MKKVISLLCLLFVVASLFTGCMTTKTMSFETFYAGFQYEDDYHTLNSYNKLGDLTEMSYRGASNGILVFRNKDGKKVKFYDPETESFILTLDNDYLESYQVSTYCDSKFILTVERDENKTGVYYTNLYDCKGNLVATKNGSSDLNYDYNLVTSRCDLIQFNGCIYRVDENGSTTRIISNPFFGSIPSVDTKTANYYYDTDYDCVTVYNHNLDVVFYWSIPYEDAYSTMLNVTSADVIIAQMLLNLPFDSDKYDFIDEEGNKFELQSIAIDVETGKEKNLKLDYAIEGIFYSRSDVQIEDTYHNMVPAEITDLAAVYPIVDKRIANYDEQKLVSIDAKTGKIKLELFTEFDGNMPGDALAKDRFKVTLDSGVSLLIDSTGKVIANANNLSNASRNETYVVYDGKIYDYNFSLKYDYVANDKEYVMMLGHGVLLRDDDNYFIYTKNGDLRTIEGSVSTSNCTQTLVVSYDDGKYYFYNEDGNSLGNLEGSYFSLIDYNYEAGYCIVSITKNSEVSYYKIVK